MVAKSQRLEMRVSVEHKALLERAAAVSGQALTAFAVSHLVQRAKEILARNEVTELTDRDREAFLRILDQDQPTPALVQVVRRHKTSDG